MTARPVFSKKEIIATAVELVRRDGKDALTARALAKELGSSTMPIYSAMGSVDAIAKAVAEEAYAMLKDYQKRKYTDDGVVDLAVGYVAFARDEKRLFRFLFEGMKIEPAGAEKAKGSPITEDTINPQASTLLDAAINDPSDASRSYLDVFNSDFGNIDDVSRFTASVDPKTLPSLAFKSWIFTHGLAELVAGGALDALTDENIADLLREAGGAFYIFEERKKGETQ